MNAHTHTHTSWSGSATLPAIIVRPRAQRPPRTNIPPTVAPQSDTPRDIMMEVATRRGLTTEDIRCHARPYHMAHTRQEIAYWIWVKCGLAPKGREFHPTRNLSGIGRLINRDHTTVLHGINSFAARHGLPSPRPTFGRFETGQERRKSRPKTPEKHATMSPQ